jgi:hypothetical protein
MPPKGLFAKMIDENQKKAKEETEPKKMTKKPFVSKLKNDKTKRSDENKPADTDEKNKEPEIETEKLQSVFKPVVLETSSKDEQAETREYRTKVYNSDNNWINKHKYKYRNIENFHKEYNDTDQKALYEDYKNDLDSGERPLSPEIFFKILVTQQHGLKGGVRHYFVYVKNGIDVRELIKIKTDTKLTEDYIKSTCKDKIRQKYQKNIDQSTVSIEKIGEDCKATIDISSCEEERNDREKKDEKINDDEEFTFGDKENVPSSSSFCINKNLTGCSQNLNSPIEISRRICENCFNKTKHCCICPIPAYAKEGTKKLKGKLYCEEHFPNIKISQDNIMKKQTTNGQQQLISDFLKETVFSAKAKEIESAYIIYEQAGWDAEKIRKKFPPALNVAYHRLGKTDECYYDNKEKQLPNNIKTYEEFYILTLDTYFTYRFIKGGGYVFIVDNHGLGNNPQVVCLKSPINVGVGKLFKNGSAIIEKT